MKIIKKVFGFLKIKIILAINLNNFLNFLTVNIFFFKIKKGVLDFEVLFTTNEFISILKPFGRTLGPKGLMPN